MPIMKILMLTGATETKAAKLATELYSLCSHQGMNIEIIKANLFTTNIELLEEQEKPTIILVVGTNKVISQTPVINGMALMYPWMGIDKVVDDISQYYKQDLK